MPIVNSGAAVAAPPPPSLTRVQLKLRTDAPDRVRPRMDDGRAYILGCPGARKTAASSSEVHLSGVLQDAAVLQPFFHAGGVSVANTLLDKSMTAETVLARLTEYFNEDDVQWGVLIVTWSGHGIVGSGDWALKDGSVSLDDVLRRWDDSKLGKQNALLVLLLDSCYSGAWVGEARRRRLLNVAVQAACAADETSVDGAFTGSYPLFQTGRIDRAELTRRLVHHRMNPRAYVPWESVAERSSSEPLQIRNSQASNQALCLQWLSA